MTEVEKLIKSKNYDIRISNDARFMDQKCTPDVVCIMADCVLNMIALQSTKGQPLQTSKLIPHSTKEIEIAKLMLIP